MRFLKDDPALIMHVTDNGKLNNLSKIFIHIISESLIMLSSTNLLEFQFFVIDCNTLQAAVS